MPLSFQAEEQDHIVSEKKNNTAFHNQHSLNVFNLNRPPRYDQQAGFECLDMTEGHPPLYMHINMYIMSLCKDQTLCGL